MKVSILKNKMYKKLESMSKDDFSLDSLCELHNNAMDEEGLIYEMSSFLDMLDRDGREPSEVITHVVDGDFNYNDKWVTLDEDGNYLSTIDIDDFVDYDAIVTYLLDNYEEDEIMEELNGL